MIDVDLDGDDDLIFPGLQQLFLSDGAGSFTPVLGSVTPPTTSPYLAGDFTGDGVDDLGVIPDSDPERISYLEGRGDGTFTPGLVPIGAFDQINVRVGEAGSTIWADIDDDGDLDTLTSTNAVVTARLQLLTPFRARIGRPFEWRFVHEPRSLAAQPQVTLLPRTRALLVSPSSSQTAVPTAFGLLSLAAPIVASSRSGPPLPSDTSTISILIPNSPALVGAQLFSQALVGFGQTATPTDFVLTNSLVDTIGL